MARSCKVDTTCSTTSESAAWVPAPANCLAVLVTSPGLRKATMQRESFHCVPISLAAAFKTPSAVFCWFSFRVMSGTRAKLAISRFSAATDEKPAALDDGPGATEVVAPDEPDEYCGVIPAVTYNWRRSELRSSSCGKSC